MNDVFKISLDNIDELNDELLLKINKADLKIIVKALEAQKVLHALQAAGVDNWEGYSIAMSTLNTDGE